MTPREYRTLRRDYFRTRIIHRRGISAPGETRYIPSIILRLYYDTLAKTLFNTVEAYVRIRLASSVYYSSRAAQCIETAAHVPTRPKQCRCGLSHVRSNSRPTTGGSISKSTSILYFHATASPRRVYTSAIFRGNSFEVFTTYTGWPANQTL